MKRKLFALPYLFWIVLFIAGPIIITLIYAFGQDSFTFDNIAKAFTGDYLLVLWRSIFTAFIVTIACLLIGYPAAYIMSQQRSSTARIIIILFVMPMWMNFLLRTYAWKALLDGSGIINQLLVALGIGEQQLLNTQGAVIMGLLYNFLPFMILPIYSALQKMNTGLLEASGDLGANKLGTFLRVIFPLSLPGIVTGTVMVFMPAITTFVVTKLLGGGHYFMYGDLIEFQFTQAKDWNFGSALAVVMFILMAVSMVIMRRIDKDSEEYIL